MTDSMVLKQAQDEYPHHERLAVVHEHDQDWVTCGACGAIYAADPADSFTVFFDTIDNGDESCQERAA